LGGNPGKLEVEHRGKNALSFHKKGSFKEEGRVNKKRMNRKSTNP